MSETVQSQQQEPEAFENGRQLIEASERWTRLMEWFAANGGLEPHGVQIRADELAAQVGIPYRSLLTYTRRMERLRVLHIRRTTVDGAFGSPRAANIYRLLVSPDEWPERRREIIAARRQQIATAVAQGSQAGIQARRQQAARRSKAADPAARPQTRIPIPDQVIEAEARRFVGIPDDELYGW